MFAPKFRLTNRLVKWMNENYFQETRLPNRIEEVFFKSKEDIEIIADNLVRYARKVRQDNLSSDLEDVIKKSPKAVVQYLDHLRSVSKTIKPDLLLSLKGNSACLADVSCSLGRLPKEFEDDITHPEHFVNYIGGIKIFNGEKKRIPEMESRIFDPNKFPGKKLAECVVNYATASGTVLDNELKSLLKGYGDQIIEYANLLRGWDKSLDEDLLDSLAGDNHNLYRYAHNISKKRLPSHLEKTMNDPKTLLQYARNIVKGRLPEELENNFASDHVTACSYAFDVIRGYACVRLPDVVHTSMIMKSSANPNDHYIKRYIAECEKDTTTSGSW